jgi:CDP-diacylglycerol--glycerol-3-phosphate 3-phosphatidyltransferase
MLLVARDIVVDALRFIAASRGKVIAANIFGKLKTVLEMVAIGAVLLNGFPFRYFDASWPQGLHIVDFIVYLATLASVISGVIYVVQNKHVFKEEK